MRLVALILGDRLPLGCVRYSNRENDMILIGNNDFE